MAAPYKRRYHHTKGRGSESYVTCAFCGKRVPRYKCFTTFRGFKITDPGIRRQVDRRNLSLMSRKMYVCPSCARHRGIVQIGRSRKSRVRKNSRLPS
ncbi:MAG: hypothetical protein B6U68_03565 [Candidatus Aenigmarchaeota archaeon ex4484_14]|nr:MAG: hypothetical protein B6U68_03565 [Candidatus Aenigmarchaeota archaeon ex4484_14]